jgi:hypothetical protein
MYISDLLTFHGTIMAHFSHAFSSLSPSSPNLQADAKADPTAHVNTNARTNVWTNIWTNTWNNICADASAE